MLLIPTRLVEPPAAGVVKAKPIIRRAMFDADTGITYVEMGADLVSVLTGHGVHVSINESLDDWCNKMLEAADKAAREEEDRELEAMAQRVEN